MRSEDFAILVGISRYADRALQPLSGPLADVELVREWLVSPGRGGVPAANVKRIVSDESRAAGPGSVMPPVFQDFMDAFLGIVLDPAGSGYLRRPNGRLYLYLSGHGFCARRESQPHAALHVANASRLVTWNIYGSYFARWARDQGLFGEIVLVMDCCRDAELLTEPLVPPLRGSADTAAGTGVRLFELYAAPRGGKAQERPIPSRNGRVHGLLTHAFIEALDHAAPTSPAVSTAEIKAYLENRWAAICGGVPADAPEAVLPLRGEISFARGADASELPQRFRLARLSAGGRVEVWGPDLEIFLAMDVSAQSVRVTRQGQTVEVPVAEGAFAVPFPVSFYRAVAHAGGDLLTIRFQPGGPDVEL